MNLIVLSIAALLFLFGGISFVQVLQLYIGLRWPILPPVHITASCFGSLPRARHPLIKITQDLLHLVLSLHYSANQLLESLLHIDVALGWSFKEQHVSILIAEVSRLLSAYFLHALLHVYLIAKNQEGQSLWLSGFTLGQENLLPVQDVLEGLRICDIVDNNAAICSSVECGPQGLESLLTCSVPNLQSHLAILYNHLFIAEVSTNCWLEGLIEFSMFKHLNEGGFAYSWVSDDYKFYKAFPKRGLGCVYCCFHIDLY